MLRKATAMMEMAAMMAGKKNTLQGDIQQAQHAPLQEFDNRTERIHLLVLLQAQTAQQHRRTLTRAAVEVRSHSFQPMTANTSRPGRKVLKAVQRNIDCQQGLNYRNFKNFGDGSHQKTP